MAFDNEKKIHRLEKKKQCSAIAAGAGDDDDHHHSMLLKEVVGTLTFGEKKRAAAAALVLLTYRWSILPPPVQVLEECGEIMTTRNGRQPREDKAFSSSSSSLLFSSLLFPSLLLRTLHGDGRAGGNSTRLWNQQPPSPPNACQRWMDGWIGRMNGEWMNGWMDGQEFTHFFHLVPIPLAKTHGGYLALVLLCYSCLRDGNLTFFFYWLYFK